MSITMNGSVVSSFYLDNIDCTNVYFNGVEVFQKAGYRTYNAVSQTSGFGVPLGNSISNPTGNVILCFPAGYKSIGSLPVNTFTSNATYNPSSAGFSLISGSIAYGMYGKSATSGGVSCLNGVGIGDGDNFSIIMAGFGGVTLTGAVCAYGADSGDSFPAATTTAANGSLVLRILVQFSGVKTGVTGAGTLVAQYSAGVYVTVSIYLSEIANGTVTSLAIPNVSFDDYTPITLILPKL